MSSGFTKLVPEIVESSIWNESPEIRCVWVAMIAKKDKDGYVRGDAKTIARISNVGIEHAEEALRKFQEKDPSSHTPDNEGRRIAAAPGGWVVLNHELYRARDEKSEHAEYMRKWREDRNSVNHSDKSVNNCESHVNHSESQRVHPSVSVSVSGSVSEKERKGSGGREKTVVDPKEAADTRKDADFPGFGESPAYDWLIKHRGTLPLISWENFRLLEVSFPHASSVRAVKTAVAGADGVGIKGAGGSFSWLRKRFQDDEWGVDKGALLEKPAVTAESSVAERAGTEFETDEEFMARVG